MGLAIAEVVPAAIGLALVNPVPIIAVILLLFTPRAKLTATAFTAGWMLGMLVVFSIMLFVVPLDDIVGDEREPSTFASIGRLVIGLVLLIMAVRQWQGQTETQDDDTTPGWIATLERASPLTAVGMGGMLSSVNPKDMAFIVAASITIAQADLGISQQFIPVAIYILVASVGVATPVIWYLAAPQRASATLAKWKIWLTRNYTTIMASVFTLFGVILGTRGLAELIG